MPIILFAIAGAMLFGGAAVFTEAQAQSAEASARRWQSLERDLLQNEVDLEELRRRARDLGLDPAEVVAGYRALDRGTLQIEDVLNMLRSTH